jgi:hypothetical protein
MMGWCVCVFFFLLHVRPKKMIEFELSFSYRAPLLTLTPMILSYRTMYHTYYGIIASVAHVSYGGATVL